MLIGIADEDLQELFEVEIYLEGNQGQINSSTLYSSFKIKGCGELCNLYQQVTPWNDKRCTSKPAD
jgi:hypothetical protein